MAVKREGADGGAKAVEAPAGKRGLKAFETLVERPGPDDRIPALIERLKDTDVLTRCNALNGLKTIVIGDSGENSTIVNAGALRAIVGALDDPWPGVRWSAALALKAIAIAYADNAEVLNVIVPPIIEMLKDNINRCTAASILYDIAKEAPDDVERLMAIPALQKALNENDFYLQNHAAFAIEAIGFHRVSLETKVLCLMVQGSTENILQMGPPAVPALLGVIKNCKNNRFRLGAVRMLAKIAAADAEGAEAIDGVFHDISIVFNDR